MVSLMVALEEIVTKVIRIHQHKNYFCTKFHDNPYNSCYNVSICTKAVDQQTNTTIHRATLLAWLRK